LQKNTYINRTFPTLLATIRRWGSLAIVAGVLLVGGSAWASALSEQIQKELESNPFLQAQQVKMRVVDEKKGCVTLELTEGPKKLRDLFRKGYEISGDGFAEVNFKEDTVKALRSIKRTLKIIKGFKGVKEIALTGAINPVMDLAENLYDDAFPQLSLNDAQAREDALPGLTKSAEMGFVRAQAELAKIYAQGMDTPGTDIKKDDQKAFFWFQKAAEQGHAASQMNLADLYAQGRGTDQDYKQAIDWYRKAAEQDRNEDARTRSQIALASLLATCPVESLRDGNAALEYAQKGCAAAPNGMAIEALAAAYGRCGRFEEAIEQEQKWIQQMRDAKSISPVEKERLLGLANQRLELYQKHQAFTASE